MANLPFELWSQVFSHLDTDDVVNCQRVSRSLLSYARDPVLWRQRLYLKSDIYSKRQTILARSQSPFKIEANPLTIDHWDPRFPNEDLDFYREYVRRNSPVRPVDWISMPKHARRKKAVLEATGLGALRDPDGHIRRLITPLDDGSVCVWDLSCDGVGTSINLGGRSPPRTLDTGRSTHRSELSPVNNTAVDPRPNHAFIARESLLYQIDLTTLQTVHVRPFAHAITAVSDFDSDAGLTLSTANQLHLYDPRTQRGQLIGGGTTSSLNTSYLANDGEPQAIVYEPNSDAYWVAGRFSHINVIDRRFFPKIRGYVASGGQISSLSILPRPHLPHLDAFTPLSARTAAKSTKDASTLIAAGSYKGHGSLELYGITPASPTSLTKHFNRHTASASKLLSAVPHGASIAAPTADGRIAWFERDGSALRTTTLPDDEMAKKILPLTGPEGHQTGTDPLFIWTAEGRVGVLTFGGGGRGKGLVEVDDDNDKDLGDESSGSEEEERVHAERMRGALEAHASEARFLRGLGLG